MRKFFTFLSSFILLPLVTYAVEFKVEGIKYNLVSATEFTCEVVFDDYSGVVTIPSTVKYNGRDITVIGIAEEAFYGCTELTRVNLPSTIRTIEKNAFAMCPRLETFTIPGSVDVVKNAFNRSGIKELRFEKYIPWGETWHGFTFGEVKDGVKRVRIFDNLPNLTKLYIDRTLPLEYSDMAYDHPNHYWAPFTGIETIEEIEFGPNIEYSGYFYNCKGLKKVTINNKDGFVLSSFGFQFCSSLNTIEGLEYVYNFGMSCLSSVKLDNWKLNPQVRYINTYAFAGTNVKELDLRNPELEISSEAFHACEQLEEIFINTNNIRSALFSDCDRINNLTFSENVTSKFIPTSLEGVKKVRNLHMRAPVPPACSKEFSDDLYLNTVLHVLPESLSAYQNAPVWKNFWNIVGDEESGIVNILDDDNSPIVSGRSLYMEEGVSYSIFDLRGCTLASRINGNFNFPAPGIYVLALDNGKVYKLNIK